MAINAELVKDYNEKYKRPNFHGYSPTLHEPFIASLVKFCKLPPGASILDVGCGQGFFSALLAKQGLRVYGVDLSEVGIATAAQRYGNLPIQFSVQDVREASFPEQMDCVFVRSCSLHNREDFAQQTEFTDKLFDYLKPGGLLIFIYNSRLFRSKKASTWRHHSMEEVRRHFSAYPGARIFFVNRLTHFAWRRLSFTRFGTGCNAMVTRLLRKGGDFVCIVEKTRVAAHAASPAAELAVATQ